MMPNSSVINLNVLTLARKRRSRGFLYPSSACIYPEYNQLDRDNPTCSDESAYPAAPDSEYGGEKLFSERLYLSFMRNCGVPEGIARFHDVFGLERAWRGGREKAPAAMCRKVAEAPDGGEIEIWGDGSQTRSFLSIEECVEGVRRLSSNFTSPFYIGSEEMVAINRLAEMVAKIDEKRISIRHVPGPRAWTQFGSSTDSRELCWHAEAAASRRFG